MKTNFVVLLVALIFVFSIASANDKYREAMQKNIKQIYSAQTPEEILSAVNAMERIGGAEKDKWEPFYYASFGYLMASVREEDGSKKDGLLDKAAEVLKSASALKGDASEIATLEGFIHMMRVTVDPATRGQQYSGLAMQSFGKAIGLNPQNPRAVAMMAQMEYGTAQFFKAPTDEPCARAQQSMVLFENFKSDNPLAPTWGKETTQALLKKCGNTPE